MSLFIEWIKIIQGSLIIGILGLFGIILIKLFDKTASGKLKHENNRKTI